MKTKAIVLSAGKGKRMNSDISKQYIAVFDRPILYYTLKAFQDSEIDEIIVVCGKNDIEYVKYDIIQKYHMTKVTEITEGGKERYDSVISGLKLVEDTDYVLVHDGARPLIKPQEINRMLSELEVCPACIMGMPVKDTIKIQDQDGYVASTPKRSDVWQIQTPQGFRADILKCAYAKMKENQDETVTDDSTAVEKYGNQKIKLIKGSYENIKVTTPEDLVVMEGILSSRE